MRTAFSVILLSLIGGGAACSSTTCAEGTIQQGDKCVGADDTTSAAMCGPNTSLHGNVCVPDFDPTQCDPTTTAAQYDPDTGITTCIGTGGGGCSATFACPAPSSQSVQTVCGQIYDLETGNKFQAANATGAKCTTGATSGPCAMGVLAYDALAFATDPQTAQQLSTGELYIDDCGRYRLPDIATPPSGFLGLGFDDADQSKIGPTGITNGVGINTTSTPGMAQTDVDGWEIPVSTTNKWAMNGGPTLSMGFWVGIFFAHKTGRDFQSGVTVTHHGAADTAHDYYFSNTDETRTTVDTNQSATGANGTSLDTNASASGAGETGAYSGTGGGLSAMCTWPPASAASLPGLVVVQEFRPINNGFGNTCDR